MKKGTLRDEQRTELLLVLKQKGNAIARLHWSPSGAHISASARGGIITVWNTNTGEQRFQLKVPSYHVFDTGWSPDECMLAASDDDGHLYVLDAASGRVIRQVDVPIAQPLTAQEIFRASVMGLAWAPDGRSVALACRDCLRIIDPFTGAVQHTSQEQTQLTGVCWSPDGRMLATTAYDETICVWDGERRRLLYRLKAGYHPAIAWSPDSHLLATANGGTITILDAQTGRPWYIIQAHLRAIRALSFSADGQYIASRAGYKERGSDTRLLIFDAQSLGLVHSIKATGARYIFTGLEFSPSGLLLATSADQDNDVQIWRIRPGQTTIKSRTYRHRNAKVALVGDAGVGKSGLALVLTGHKFEATESTHGRRVWPFSANRVRIATGGFEIRETVLWDLAGQPGYRLIHQLHLSDVAVGVILFDSRNELDPFSGVRHWIRALRHAAGVSLESTKPQPKAILVAARIDRGPIAASHERVEALLREIGATSYFETSAREGTGVAELRQGIADAVDWDQVPTVSSNILVQAIRDFILSQAAGGHVLATTEDLLRSFNARPVQTTGKRTAGRLTRGPFEGYLQSLQSLGLVRRFSFGDLVLLQPERLDAYASSIIFAAQQEPDGMGSIDEDSALAGRFPIPASERLGNAADERLLLVATIEDLVSYEIAFRETSGDYNMLVFPSQLTRENPELPEPEGKDLRIDFQGHVLNIYATLVVRLAHSSLFQLKQLWRNAALFMSEGGREHGLFLSQRGDGEGSLTLFYPGALKDTRPGFEDYVLSHVKRRAQAESVTLQRSLICSNPSCRTPFSEAVLRKRRLGGFNSVVCSACEARTPLPGAAPDPQGAPTEAVAQIDYEADATRDLEVRLLSASGEMLTGRFRKWAGAGRATLAVVFTDLVGSTRLGEELGDEEMFGVRSAHFAAARKLITKFRGYEVKTIGDAFMVAFRTTVDALNFCLALRCEPGDSRLAVRAGIHVGPVRIDEEDVFGRMVNFAARVVSAIKGPEIWLSDRAYDDVRSERSSMHRQITWEEHKGLELKGFDGSYSLWRMRD